MEEVFCEEVLPVLAPVLSPSHVLPLLVDLSQSNSYPLFYLALKMLTVVSVMSVPHLSVMSVLEFYACL